MFGIDSNEFAPFLGGKERIGDQMNVKTLVGMQVFAVDAGKQLGSVERLLFSPEKRRVEYFVVSSSAGIMDEPEPQKMIAVDKIKGMGQDAIMVDSEQLLDTIADGEIPAGLVAFDEIEQERVLTEGGEQVGDVSSIDFHDETFAIDYLEVGRGFLSGSLMIPVEQVVSVGEDVIIVKDSVLESRRPQDEVIEDVVEENA